MYVRDAACIAQARLSRAGFDAFVAEFGKQTIYIPKQSARRTRLAISELHAAGKSQREIAMLMSISERQVRRVLNTKKSGGHFLR